MASLLPGRPPQLAGLVRGPAGTLSSLGPPLSTARVGHLPFYIGDDFSQSKSCMVPCDVTSLEVALSDFCHVLLSHIHVEEGYVQGRGHQRHGFGAVGGSL